MTLIRKNLFSRLRYKISGTSVFSAARLKKTAVSQQRAGLKTVALLNVKVNRKQKQI